MRAIGWFAALAGVWIASVAWGGEIKVEPVARIEQAGKVLELVGATRTADGSKLLIAVAESESNAGLLAYQVHEVDPKTGKSRQLLRTALDKRARLARFFPNKLRSLVLTSNGALILCGRFDQESSAIRKVSQSGDVLREVPHPDEKMARMASPVVSELLLTEDDEVLTISGDTFLYDRSLTQKWRLPKAQDDLVMEGIYDRRHQRFVLARIAGKFSKFGTPMDAPPQVIVMAVTRDGMVVGEVTLDGMTPRLALAGDGVVVLRDTLRKEGRFVLTWLDGGLKATSSCVLVAMPEPSMLPSVYPLRMVVRPDRHVVVIGNPGNKLFAREWNDKGEAVAANDSLWPTPVGGELWLEVQGDKALIVSGQEEEPGVDGGQVVFKQSVRIDRLKLRP